MAIPSQHGAAYYVAMLHRVLKAGKRDVKAQGLSKRDASGRVDVMVCLLLMSLADWIMIFVLE